MGFSLTPMKRFSLALPTRAALLACALPVHAQGPVLTTPGTATWETLDTPTGTQTIFTIFENSVFDWNQFNLGGGSSLVFEFQGGNSVVNQLNGSGLNILDGSVVATGGSIGFFSPNGDLLVNGSITAGSVTLATTNVDVAAFNAGGGYQLSGNGGFNTLTVNGTVTATAGDVVLAGRSIDVGGSALITAADAVRFGAGDGISVSGGGDEQLEVSGRGFLTHLGVSRASRIEMKSAGSIANRGELGIQNGRVFVEVGPGGVLRNEAMIIDELVYEGTVVGEIDAAGSEADALAAVSDARLKLPALKNLDGSQATESRVVRVSTPTSASSDATRDAKRKDERVAARRDSKPLFSQQSFFDGRMRGGKAKER